MCAKNSQKARKQTVQCLMINKRLEHTVKPKICVQLAYENVLNIISLD